MELHIFIKIITKGQTEKQKKVILNVKLIKNVIGQRDSGTFTQTGGYKGILQAEAWDLCSFVNINYWKENFN
jgi:hypothetical protein